MTGKDPVTAKDKGVPRRWFLNGLLGFSLVGLFVNGLYPVVRFLYPPKESSQGRGGSVKVGKVSELPPGGSKKFRYQGYPAILINYDGKYYAYGAVCTHLGCIVHWKDERGCAMSMGDQIHCVCHAGHFDARTGNVLGGPPPSALPRLKVEQMHDEVVVTGWDNMGYMERLATYKR